MAGISYRTNKVYRNTYTYRGKSAGATVVTPTVATWTQKTPTSATWTRKVPRE